MIGEVRKLDRYGGGGGSGGSPHAGRYRSAGCSADFAGFNMQGSYMQERKKADRDRGWGGGGRNEGNPQPQSDNVQHVTWPLSSIADTLYCQTGITKRARTGACRAGGGGLWGGEGVGK